MAVLPTPTFSAVDVIRAKRDGLRLTDEQIRWFLDAYTHGVAVADEQASALLMAVFFQGLDVGELATWTEAMIASGERLDLSGFDRPTVDKHSTGGVGDKTSLVLCPLLAACGAVVPQLSGRGLGHTGGTLDKLDAIAGFRTTLTNEAWLAQLHDVGCVISAAGAGLAPADSKLYALRDVTATVESIPLIASSIMSKKIAEGTGALVLDVKFGTGAFKREFEQARVLAETMVGIGKAAGLRVAALLTEMNTPLGRAVGNALEVQECVDLMTGRFPVEGGPVDDLAAVTLALAEEGCRLGGLTRDPREALESGAAYEMWRRMVVAQGGDPDAPLPVAQHVVPALAAPRAGWVTRLDALAVGVASWRLGAGRARKEDSVSAIAGIRCLVKEGEWVDAGQPALELHIDDPERVPAALDALVGALDVGDAPPAARPLVREVLR